MYYFWALLWLLATLGCGFSMDARTNGAAHTITITHCVLSDNSITKTAYTSDSSCTAIEQDYGWPFMTRKGYSQITTTDGIPLSTYQTSLKTSSTQAQSTKRKLSPNFMLAGAVLATAIGILGLVASWRPRAKYRGDTIHF